MGWFRDHLEQWALKLLSTAPEKIDDRIAKRIEAEAYRDILLLHKKMDLRVDVQTEERIKHWIKTAFVLADMSHDLGAAERIRAAAMGVQRELEYVIKNAGKPPRLHGFRTARQRKR